MYRIKHCKTQRERDLHVIEGLVRRFGSLSQVEIHDFTHLQRSAISGLVRDLLKRGRLVEAGRSDNSMGFGRESARWRERPRDWKEARTGWRISFCLARTKPSDKLALKQKRSSASALPGPAS